MLKRLRSLEEGISEVRKSQIPTWFCALETPEEFSLIRQAKKEHHPIFAELSGKALVNQDSEPFWQAIEEGTIDCIAINSDLVLPFLRDAVEEHKISLEKMLELTKEVL